MLAFDAKDRISWLDICQHAALNSKKIVDEKNVSLNN